MNFVVRLPLQTTPVQRERLEALQRVFAQACNALAPLARNSRCWNRVALHHMAYKELRRQFPDMGSQMACNAIYSVSRACRVIYQSPASPFNLSRLGDRALPLVQFAPQAPVYFDRHTLSIKSGEVSMFTLDGRMRFKLDLTPAVEQRFRETKLREIVLTSRGGVFALTFSFSEPGSEATDDVDSRATDPAAVGELPEYLIVTDSLPLPPVHSLPFQAALPS